VRKSFVGYEDECVVTSVGQERYVLNELLSSFDEQVHR
jgi:hypothetical protein